MDPCTCRGLRQGVAGCSKKHSDVAQFSTNHVDICDLQKLDLRAVQEPRAGSLSAMSFDILRLVVSTRETLPDFVVCSFGRVALHRAISLRECPRIQHCIRLLHCTKTVDPTNFHDLSSKFSIAIDDHHRA